MKTKITFALAIYAATSFSPYGGTKGGCQNIGINTTGAAPATNHLLEIIQPSTADSTHGLWVTHEGAIIGTGYGAFIKKAGASTTNIGLFSTATGGTNNYAAIFEQGNVGIGTTSPTYKLHVVGKIKTDNINETSDMRLKKNVNTIENALVKVQLLRGVSFNWKTEEFKERNFDTLPQIGLIAQEVEKVLPQIVDTDKEGYKSVEYSKLVALLIEAIKEQQTQNSEMKIQIHLLKAEIGELKENQYSPTEEVKK